MSSNMRHVPAEETETGTKWLSVPGVLMAVLVLMVVGMVWFWRTPEYPNGGIASVEDELRTSAGTPARQQMRAHRIVREETSDLMHDKALPTSWTCEDCAVRLMQEPDPKDPTKVRVALVSIERADKPDWRSVTGRQVDDTTDLIGVDGVMAAMFKSDGMPYVIWNDLGKVTVKPVVPHTPEIEKMVAIFDLSRN